MKRLIAILVALQIGLTPFCAVFAMETIPFSKDASCAPQEQTEMLHGSKTDAHAICCVAKPVQQAPYQIRSSEEFIPLIPSVQTISSFCIQQEGKTKTPPNGQIYQPDDFERISQSKRE
jgi:hypothetical protein